MSCPFEEKVALYVGDDLAAAEMRAVEEHIAGCAECAELAGDLVQDREWLGTRPPESEQADYAAMRARIRREVAKGRVTWVRWLGLAAAAAVVVILAVGLKSTRTRPPAHIPVPASARIEIKQAPGTAVVASKHKLKLVPTATPEISLEAMMRMIEELDAAPPPEWSFTGSDSPVEMRIATRDPNVTIVLVQESEGDLR
jgi:anti-sigma factor RsiW